LIRRDGTTAIVPFGAPRWPRIDGGVFLALSKDSVTKVFSMAEPTVKFNYRAARHGGKAPTTFLTIRYLGRKKNLVK